MINHKICDLPMEERPYERCLVSGPGVLSDAELLAVIMRTGSRGMSALDLAGEILRSCPYGQGLTGLHHLHAGQLRQIKGIGKVKSVQLICLAELARRMASMRTDRSKVFREPGVIADHYMEMLRHLERETVICVMLDTRNRFIGDSEVSVGTVNASFVSPREVFRLALSYQAVRIILLHNHPSGDPAPSPEDIAVTRQIVSAGSLIGIPLLDHIIFGDRSYTSLSEKDPAIFGNCCQER